MSRDQTNTTAQMPKSTDTQRPSPAGSSRDGVQPAGELRQEIRETVATTTKLETSTATPSPTQPGPALMGTTSSSSSTAASPALSDGPLPPSPTPPAAPVRPAPPPLDVPPRQATPQVPARFTSPALGAHQRAGVQSQTVRFDIPDEQDAMNQYCRLCCCECPVWMGLLSLTIFSLMAFISFLFWPKTIRVHEQSYRDYYDSTLSTLDQNELNARAVLNT